MEWKGNMLISCLLVLSVRSQEETSCSCSLKEQQFVGINVTHSMTSPPNAITVSFYNASSGKDEKVLVCDFINNKYVCHCGKDYTLATVKMSNTFYVVVSRTIKCTDGRFAITINEEKTSLCLRDDNEVPAIKRRKRYANWCQPNTSKGNPENFQDENVVNGLDIRIPIAISATTLGLSVVVVASLFQRNRLQKLCCDVTQDNNHISLKDKTEIIVRQNPGLTDERSKEIEDPANEENEKIRVAITH